MSHATEPPTGCAHPGCDANHPAGKWGDIRAAEKGWFHSKSGDAYCPKHVPQWVAKWRARQAGKMNVIAIQTIIGVATFLVSVAVSMFVSGTRWGRVETSLRDLQLDRVRQADITGLRDRLSRIEGMFTLTLKDGDR